MNQQPLVKKYYGTLMVTPNMVTVAHKKKYKEIHISEITGIAVFRAGLFNKGYIRFSFLGGEEYCQVLERLNPEREDSHRLPHRLVLDFSQV